MKEHEIRELVNRLRDIAVEYRDAQQLRERIAHEVNSAIKPGTLTNEGTIQSGNSGRVPAGYVLVPVDATRAMIDAARSVEEDGYDAMHKAMIAVAPQPQNVQQNIPESISDGWTGNALADSALVMLDRIDVDDPIDEYRIEDIKSIVQLLAAAPSASDGWIPVSERMPEPGVLVLVYAPPQPCDHPGSVRIGFDFIDPDGDDPTYWFDHGESYEHFCMVACDGMVGPTEKAPYTHWQPLPDAPKGV
ncbi:DUF551 domain-containing protein [Phytobacter ursingii]|uniref:DUF551 domain-containing protein n=1 Tax=Phytobacter ursingii TaxID=1972431 RepID=A0AB35RJG2_9ENTR|nr:DUF551 domain-containing protein [Phytobacter ursingii]MDV2861825.1 DUF551 domain-containing protein [Phytobacter ursingii]